MKQQDRTNEEKARQIMGENCKRFVESGKEGRFRTTDTEDELYS